MDGDDATTAVLTAPAAQSVLRFDEPARFHGPARTLRGSMISAATGTTRLESVEIEALEDRGFALAFLTHEIDGAPQEILFARGGAISLRQEISALTPLTEGGFRLEYLLRCDNGAFGMQGDIGMRFDCPERPATQDATAPSRALPHGALGVLTIGAARRI